MNIRYYWEILSSSVFIDKFALLSFLIKMLNDEIGDMIFARAHRSMETHHQWLFGTIQIVNMSP